MQGKGFIKLIAWALSLACLYHLSFTLVASKVKADAQKQSKGDSHKESAYLDSIDTHVVLNLGLAKYTYRQVKDKQLNLGLDLKGGMNVTMEIALADLLRAMTGYSKDPAFNAALLEASNNSAQSQQGFVSLFAKAYAKIAPEGKLAPLFARPENKDRIQITSSNAEIIAVIEKEAQQAIDRSFHILRTRIDKFGVSQPNIQKIGSSRILIELPGVTDPDRVRKLLQGSAQLSFWETYENSEVLGLLDGVNNLLATQLALAQTDQRKTESNKKKSKKSSAAANNTQLAKAPDSAGSNLALLKEINKGDKTNDSLTNAEGIARKNPLFSLLRPNIRVDSQGQIPGAGPVVGLAAAKDTAQINAYFERPEIKAALPSDLRLRWGIKALEGTHDFSLYALKASGRGGKAALNGEVVTNARADIDPTTGRPEVIMFMNAEGAKAWKRLTATAAAAGGKCVAIVLDDAVYTAPTVKNEIAGGVSNISGSFTTAETTDMANILKAGKLPAPAKIIEETTVGPTLGAEAITAGLLSCGAGLLAVLVFMFAYYSKAGLIANVALVFNLFLLGGVLASFGAVLTLPGIAGIILTLGMAVDANVIIFERIKEELALGKPFKRAINDGFAHAYAAIIDANVTTLLLGIILYIFSTGLVQGFATTLIIGIFTSMFTAVFITRLLLEGLAAKNKVIAFSTSFTKNWFKNTSFDFVGKRKVFYIASAILILAGGVALLTKGLSYGVDFQGGRTFSVRFEKPVKVAQIRESLSKVFDNQAPEVKTFGTANQIKITTAYQINNPETDASELVENKLLQGLADFKGNPSEILSRQKVGPSIASDIRTAAYYALIIALIIIYAYILLRFKSWQFSVGAVVSLLHDVLLIVAIYALLDGVVPFSLDIDQTFVAAILTVMGYSMNDTVVVFDRVREYMGLAGPVSIAGNQTLPSIINKALNSTLSRTVVTALTTLLVLLVLFVFGGETLRGFSFSMLIGILAGTYSSIFVATPIVVDFMRKK